MPATMPAMTAAISTSIPIQMPPFSPYRAKRRALALPGRVTWKDARGTTRFASVITRDISDSGVFIEWNEPTSIPLFRLVTFQLENEVRDIEGIPQALRAGKVLSAVYRLGFLRRSIGTPEGYGLRFLVEPVAHAMSRASVPVQATA